MRHLSTRLVLISLLLVVLAGCGQNKPQNVILIVVDTTRADHLSVYGYDRPTTPHLEQWAERGLVFDRAFAPSPWTLPTFGSVLTGLWPSQHSAGTRLQTDGKKWRRAPLSQAVTTLPEAMKREGFATGAIVNNAFLREQFGAARGFDFYDYKKSRRARPVVDLAHEWLSENGQKPFFMMIHMIDPHLPYSPPSDFLGKFGDVGADEIPARGRKNIVDMMDEMTDSDWLTLTARYDEEIAFVDQELGRLFGLLEDQGLWDQTLIILTSDHGEEFLDHGGFEHGHSMFQEVLRVPLMIWGPGVRSGRVESPVSLLDLKPTILDAMGIEVDESLEGVSLWDSLQTGARQKHRELLAQNVLWGREHQAIVSWPYKLIHYPKSDRRQLFDLAGDPEEAMDLAESKPAVAEQLERRLLDRLADLQIGAVGSGVKLTEEMEEELRALGYLD
jgi:arylsulfatase A-like enzyme